MDDFANASMAAVAMGAIQSRDIKTLSLCLDKCGIDVLWSPSSSNTSLLEYAVEENFLSAVSLLFSKIPSGPSYVNAIKQAFVLAMRRDFKDVIKLFLVAALNGRLQMTLLEIFTHAIHRGLEDIATQVVKLSNFDLNCEEWWDGEHPLSIVVFKRCFHLADMLIKCGAVVDAPNNRGETALVTACSLHFEDCCQVLLKHGADPNHRPLLGLSPLRACCCSSTKDLQKTESIVDILLNAGLNVNHESWIYALPFSDCEFCETLRHLGKQPRSLKLLCCVAIRAHLAYVHHGISILNFLAGLPLPLPLKKFVTLCNDNDASKSSDRKAVH